MVVEETYDRMFTVISRVRFSVTKEDDGVPVDCIVDHPAAKDLQAQRHLDVLCEWLPKYSLRPAPVVVQVQEGEWWWGWRW